MIAEARTGSRLRKLAAVAAAAGIPLTLALLWHRSSTRERGSQLFHGATPLTGRVTGIADPLPAEATRCENCHALEFEPAAAPTPKSGEAAAPAERVGPKLGKGSLTRAVKRRGGPASVYTSDAFCRLLREGVDPAQIVLPQLMPRYTLTDRDCDALWAYLTSS